MIDRYSYPKMAELWSDEYRFEKMLEIEIFTCEAWQKKGIITKKDLLEIKKKAVIDITDIRKHEEKSHHETVAFVDSLSEKIGSASRFLHYGLTSSDVLDTAMAATLKESLTLVLDLTKNFRKSLFRSAKKYKDLVMIGRTHGMHGEPITLGLKILNWVYECDRCIDKLHDTKNNVSVGKVSGSVGTYANLLPYVENYVCKKMHLKLSKISNQIIQRDIYSDYLYAIVGVGNLLERIAMEIRHLSRTEIGELGEPFGSKQKGSSSMPHKRNPILCERICGLSRVLRGNLLVAFENIPLWDERDISHSSSERIILPDSSELICYMVDKMNYVINDLVVDKKRILENLQMTKGNIFSQALMLKMVKNGADKGKVYDIVQKSSFENNGDLLDMLLGGSYTKKFLKKSDIEDLRDYSYYTKYVDDIFERFQR